MRIKQTLRKTCDSTRYLFTHDLLFSSVLNFFIKRIELQATVLLRNLGSSAARAID